MWCGERGTGTSVCWTSAVKAREGKGGSHVRAKSEHEAEVKVRNLITSRTIFSIGMERATAAQKRRFWRSQSVPQSQSGQRRRGMAQLQ